MGNCRELFSILGVVFPNRMRALLSDGELEGASGRFDPETLRTIGAAIEASCPKHEKFETGAVEGPRMTCVQSLVSSPTRSNFVVRYIHFDHGPGKCQVLATTSGPFDAIAEIELKVPCSLPLTGKELAVARSIAAGMSVSQVASESDHSIHTVRNQLKSALRSVNKHSQAQLAFLIRDWVL